MHNREIKINSKKRRMNVFEKKGFENHPTNKDPEVDNYACITLGRDSSDNCWAVSFNGHMCKRTNYNLLDGMNPFMALDLTLLEFRGLKNDARIGSIAYSSPREGNTFWLGMTDIEKPEKRIYGYPNKKIQDLENKLIFIYDKRTSLESTFNFKEKGIKDPSRLAEHIHENIIGKEIIFGLATGIALKNSGEFELGVYNNDITEEKVKEWKREYASKS